jgi:DNA-directed RNA polymerase subunit RPC12/RpoP
MSEGIKPPEPVEVLCKSCGATWTTSRDIIGFDCQICGSAVLVKFDEKIEHEH